MVTDDYRGYQKGVYVWLPEEPVRAMAAVSQAGAPFLPPIYRRDAEDAEKNLNRQKPRATTGLGIFPVTGKGRGEFLFYRRDAEDAEKNLKPAKTKSHHRPARQGLHADSSMLDLLLSVFSAGSIVLFSVCGSLCPALPHTGQKVDPVIAHLADQRLIAGVFVRGCP